MVRDGVKVLSLVGLAAWLLVGVVQAQEGRDLKQADKGLRQHVIYSLQKGARTAGVTVMTDNFVVASRDDLFVVNAALAGVDKLNSRSFQSDAGVDVMFVYLSLPREFKLPEGFYTVRVTGAGRAQLLNAKGEVQATYPAAIGLATGPGTGGGAGERVKLTVEVGQGCITIDIHLGWSVGVKICRDNAA